MKEAHGADGVPLGSIDGAARSRWEGPVSCLSQMGIVVTVLATTYLGLENHPAEWVNVKMLVS